MNKHFVFTVIVALLFAFIGCSGPTNTSTTEHKPPVDTDLQLGKEIALATKAVLGKHLTHAIQTKGTAGAVDFCSLQAISLTDSVGFVKHAKVSRLSDLPRNPNNFAREPFLSQISTYKTQLLNGDKLNGNSILHEGKEYRCYPIVTNGMCLQCHGKKGTDIAPETLKVLNEKYPNDLATGYSANQLRGIWVVEMN